MVYVLGEECCTGDVFEGEGVVDEAFGVTWLKLKGGKVFFGYGEVGCFEVG